MPLLQNKDMEIFTKKMKSQLDSLKIIIIIIKVTQSTLRYTFLENQRR